MKTVSVMKDNSSQTKLANLLPKFLHEKLRIWAICLKKNI